MHLKSALSSVRRSPFQAFSAVFVLALTFFTATTFVFLAYGSERVLKYFETRPQIIAFIKKDTKEEDIAKLQYKIQDDSRVREVKYIDKNKALEIYKIATKTNPELSELVSSSIFPASIEFSVKDLSYTKNLLDSIKKEEIVESVGFTASIGDEESVGNVITRLKSISFYIRLAGVSLVGLLSFVSFIVLLTIINMRLSAKREEIEILSLIGATKNFIRKPIILEALIYSYSGVLLGSFLSMTLLLYSSPTISRFFGEIYFLPEKLSDTFLIFISIFLIEFFVATLIAYISGFLAVNRARKNS